MSDILGELFNAAEDYEADMLTALAERAGLLWTCREPRDSDDECLWVNRADETTCGDCGASRPAALVTP